jgi:hypothetical protein
MNGLGSFVKVNNNVIDNNSINPLKLTGADGNSTKYLSADGNWKVISGGSGSFNNSFTGDVNANNYKITSIGNGISNNDAVNKSQLDLVNTNLTSYVDNKYLNLIQASQTLTGAGQENPILNNIFTVLAKLDMNNNKIVNCLDPTDNLDVSNKSYVDNNYGETLLYTSSISIGGQGQTITTPLLNAALSPIVSFFCDFVKLCPAVLPPLEPAFSILLIRPL